MRLPAILLAAALVAAAACTDELPTPELPTFAPTAPTETQGPFVTPGAPPAGQQGPTEPTSLGQAILHHALIATSIDPATGELVDEGDAFPEGTRQILVAVGWDFAEPGTKLGMRVFQRGVLIYEQDHVVEGNAEGSGARGFVFGMVAEGGFTADAYQVEISYNGVPDELLAFTVGNVPRPGIILGEGEDSGPIPYKDPSEVLVITRASVLRANMGAAAEQVLAAAGQVGQLHDLDEGGVSRSTPEAAAELVKQLLRSGPFRYLLIVGNHDAVPFFQVDNPLASSEEEELEDWNLPADWLPSDDPYADLDGDEYGAPDLAVARIPSSDDAQLLLTQLGENVPPDGHGYALLNQKRRSQGGAVVAAMNTGSAMEVEFAPPADVDRFNSSAASSARYLYILLHGIGTLTDEWSADIESWTALNTGSPFAGEWEVKGSDQRSAVTVAGNPGSRGLVSVGACYGAWTLDVEMPPGLDRPNDVHKTADNSLALHYLKSGSRAFVADTHLSYSVPLDLNSLPIGRTGFEIVYWKGVSEGLAPIDAFQRAKVEVAAAIPELVAAQKPNLANITLKTLHYMVYLGRP